MKLRKGDSVMVISGRDKGKTGEITSVIPKLNRVVVSGINVAKRHTKPSQKHPQGGILDLIRPIDAGKVMVVDPQTGVPARVGYRLNADGSKERVFKPSRYAKPKQAEKARAKTQAETKKTETDQKEPKA